MDAADKLEVNMVNLRNAVLCVDCEAISDSPHEVCRVCGSRSLLNVAQIFGGALPSDRAHIVDSAELTAKRAIPSIRRMPHRRKRRATAQERSAA